MKMLLKNLTGKKGNTFAILHDRQKRLVPATTKGRLHHIHNKSKKAQSTHHRYLGDGQ